MKRYLALALLLQACSTTPVVSPIPPWPAAPAELQAPAPELTPLTAEQHQLSDLIKNSNENYTQYYLLKQQYEGWQQWYRDQQKIWQGLK